MSKKSLTEQQALIKLTRLIESEQLDELLKRGHLSQFNEDEMKIIREMVTTYKDFGVVLRLGKVIGSWIGGSAKLILILITVLATIRSLFGEYIIDFLSK